MSIFKGPRDSLFSLVPLDSQHSSKQVIFTMYVFNNFQWKPCVCLWPQVEVRERITSDRYLVLSCDKSQRIAQSNRKFLSNIMIEKREWVGSPHLKKGVGNRGIRLSPSPTF